MTNTSNFIVSLLGTSVHQVVRSKCAVPPVWNRWLPNGLNTGYHGEGRVDKLEETVGGKKYKCVSRPGHGIFLNQPPKDEWKVPYRQGRKMKKEHVTSRLQSVSRIDAETPQSRHEEARPLASIQPLWGSGQSPMRLSPHGSTSKMCRALSLITMRQHFRTILCLQQWRHL